MNKEKWEEISKKIKNNFEVEDDYLEDLDPGQADVIEFNGPQGKLKVRFITRPKMLDKKTTYSNRVGSDVKVDYVFSDTEEVNHLEVFTWVEGDWKKIEGDNLF